MAGLSWSIVLMLSWTRRDILKTGSGAAAAAGFSCVPRQARAVELTDLLLVLSADVSRSVDDEKFKLQRDGYAAALSDARVVGLMQAGAHKRVAVAFVEWSGVSAAAVMVPWTAIGSHDAAEAFAGKVRTAPRIFRDRTSISTGIDFAVAQMQSAPFGADRRVIDVSGDGTHNSGRDVGIARDEAVAKGFTVNGIAILSAVPLAFNPAHTHPPGGLLKYYEDNVIGGPGAFALSADGFPDFGQAIVQKLIKEIANHSTARTRPA
jgi:Protein of unknown function (DUF1194)